MCKVWAESLLETGSKVTALSTTESFELYTRMLITKTQTYGLLGGTLSDDSLLTLHNSLRYLNIIIPLKCVGNWRVFAAGYPRNNL
jgi:hypothetical protein